MSFVDRKDTVKVLSELVKINSINLRTPTLDDVFLSYTGRSIREEHAAEQEWITYAKTNLRRGV